jgi:prephenate dehydrogenase
MSINQAKPDKVAILGLGLMGGSLGLVLAKKGLCVTGWARNPATVQEAYRIGAINYFPSSLEDAVTGAKYIFVATPVTTIGQMIKNCLPFTAPGTIFSDLGSIKEAILTEVFSFLPPTHFFVGAHPMTGSEQQGITATDPFLYQNAPYIIIDDPRTPRLAAEQVMELLRTTGAHFLTLTAVEHDRIVATVSHLPHLMAAVLAETAGLEEELHPGTLGLAAGGFRDTTRVATGSPDIWEGILLGNRLRVLEAITTLQSRLEIFKNSLMAGDREKLRGILEKAREVRTQIPLKNKGFLTLLREMVVVIEDKPGAIEEVLHHLAQAGLNIKDIEILRVREGEGGTLRLALETSEAVEEAVRILEAQGFKVRTK